MVIIEDGLTRQLHELGTLLRKHLYHAGENENNLNRLLPVVLNRCIRSIYTCIELYYELVAEPNLTRIEEVFKHVDELPKYLIYQLVLHFWRQLLVEVILFNDQVKVIVESIAYRVLDFLTELWVEVVWFV